LTYKVLYIYLPKHARKEAVEKHKTMKAVLAKIGGRNVVGVAPGHFSDLSNITKHHHRDEEVVVHL
jgi:hypothetical protein